MGSVLELRQKSADWTALERNQLLALVARFSSSAAVDIAFGVTDDGDPWCAIVDEDGDVVLHVARIRGRFVVHAARQDAAAEARDLWSAVTGLATPPADPVPEPDDDILPPHIFAAFTAEDDDDDAVLPGMNPPSHEADLPFAADGFLDTPPPTDPASSYPVPETPPAPPAFEQEGEAPAWRPPADIQPPAAASVTIAAAAFAMAPPADAAAPLAAQPPPDTAQAGQPIHVPPPQDFRPASQAPDIGPPVAEAAPADVDHMLHTSPPPAVGGAPSTDVLLVGGWTANAAGGRNFGIVAEVVVGRGGLMQSPPNAHVDFVAMPPGGGTSSAPGGSAGAAGAGSGFLSPPEDGGGPGFPHNPPITLHAPPVADNDDHAPMSPLIEPSIHLSGVVWTSPDSML